MTRRVRPRRQWAAVAFCAVCLVGCGAGHAKKLSLHARADQVCESEASIAECESLLGEAANRTKRCADGPNAVYWDGCGDEQRTRADIAARLGRLRQGRAHSNPGSAPASSTTPSAQATAKETNTNTPGNVPTLVQVQAAATIAAANAPAACGLSPERALVAASIDVTPAGEIADVKLHATLSVGPASLLECVRKAFTGLTFSPYAMPSDANASWRREGNGTWPLYDCESGASAKSCRAARYGVTLILGEDGSAAKPTQQQLTGFAAASTASAKAAAQGEREAACSATKASGFPAGSYSGQASQNVTGRDGSKVRGWKSLTITVDTNGCTTWRGADAGDIWMPGDAARNLDKINTTCISEGDATIAKTASGFKLTARTTRKAAAGGPTRFHVWKCPGGNVQTPLSIDLSGEHCVVLGNAADAGEERVGGLVCNASDAFDELADRKFTLDKDGSLRLSVTLVDEGMVVLHRVDTRR